MKIKIRNHKQYIASLDGYIPMSLVIEGNLNDLDVRKAIQFTRSRMGPPDPINDLFKTTVTFEKVFLPNNHNEWRMSLRGRVPGSELPRKRQYFWMVRVVRELRRRNTQLQASKPIARVVG